MIVADTNLIGYLLLQNAQSDLAEEVLMIDSVWAAPLLWRSELRNVLCLYVRQKLLTLSDATEIMEAAKNLLHDHEYEVISTDVMALAIESGASAYDCEFVALAKDLKVPLVTSDKAMHRHFPNVATSPAAFAETGGPR